MLTEFGKFCRKLRIDRGELLKNMADKLSITPAYLSSIETGKKIPPLEWHKEIVSIYNLSEEQSIELKNTITQARNTNKVDINSVDPNNQELILAFARKINSLGNDQKDAIQKILNSLNNGGDN